MATAGVHDAGLCDPSVALSGNRRKTIRGTALFAGGAISIDTLFRRTTLLLISYVSSFVAVVLEPSLEWLDREILRRFEFRLEARFVSRGSRTAVRCAALRFVSIGSEEALARRALLASLATMVHPLRFLRRSALGFPCCGGGIPNAADGEGVRSYPWCSLRTFSGDLRRSIYHRCNRKIADTITFAARA